MRHAHFMKWDIGDSCLDGLVTCIQIEWDFPLFIIFIVTDV